MVSSTTSSANGANWKPGGIQAKPPTKPTANGKSTYYRHVPGRNPTAVLSHRLAFAANYAHFDDKDVSVEDLSQIDIDSAIQSKFEAILPLLLHEPVGFLVDSFTDFEQNVEFGYTIEVFDVSGLKIERRTYTDFDVRSDNNRQYSQGPIALKVDEDRKQHFNGQEASLAIVQYIMAEILNELNGELEGRKDERYRKLATKAHGRVYRAEDPAAEVARCQEIIDGRVPMPAQVRKWLVEVRKNYRNTPNKHHILQIDRASAKICDMITGKDIVILRDKNHELMAAKQLRSSIL